MNIEKDQPLIAYKHQYQSAQGNVVEVVPYTLQQVLAAVPNDPKFATDFPSFEKFAGQLAAYKPTSVPETQAWVEKIGSVLAAYDYFAPSWHANVTGTNFPYGMNIAQVRRKLEAILMPTLSEGLTVAYGSKMQATTEQELVTAFESTVDSMGLSQATSKLIIEGLKTQMKNNPAFYSYLLRRSNELFKNVVGNLANSQQHDVLVKAYQGIREVFDFDRDVLYNRHKTRRNEVYAAKKKIDRSCGTIKREFELTSNTNEITFSSTEFAKLHSVYVRASKPGSVGYDLSGNIKDRAITFSIDVADELVWNSTDKTQAYKLAKGRIQLYRHLRFDEAKGVAFKMRAYPYFLKRFSQPFFFPHMVQYGSNQDALLWKPSGRINWEIPLDWSTDMVSKIKFKITLEGYTKGTQFTITTRTLPDVKQLVPSITFPSTSNLHNWLYLLSRVNLANYTMDQVRQKLAKNRKYRLLKGDERLMKGVMQYWGFKEDGRLTKQVTKGDQLKAEGATANAA